jgi:hypothetical protein
LDSTLRLGVLHELDEAIGVTTELIGRREGDRVDPLLDHGKGGDRKAGDAMRERRDKLAERGGSRTSG